MLYVAFEEVVADEVRTRFRELVKRRAEGVPVAYLVGKKEFYSLSLRVTPDVLIPRPETELVVVEALDAVRALRPTSDVQSQTSEQVVIADVGTGSGAIAVAIAKHAPQCRVTAIDLSPSALVVARENAVAHGVAERMEFVCGDLLSALPAEPEYAAIVSNPPYVSAGEYAALSPEIRNHEPRQALVSGPKGTEVIERLIPQVAERLLPDGWLIIEVSPMVASRVSDLIAADGRFAATSIKKDLAGLARVVKARRKA
jgi:release factor glutamine methyltransferase